MSESSFPFEGQTMTQGTEDFSEPGGDRTKLFVLAGVAGVLVLAVAVYFLLFAGGSSDETVKPVGKPVVVVPDTGPAPAANTPVKKERLSAKSFGNDPFEALITEPVESTGGTVTDVTLTATPIVAAPVVSAPVGPAAPVASKTHRFRVVSVAPDNSSVDAKVDGKLFKNLRAGEVFGTYFKVVLISGQVNSFQFGEEKFNVIGTKSLTIA